MILNEQQRHAVEKAVHWFYNESHNRNLFVIAGYAGCGKSASISTLVTMLGLRKYEVLYAALTGKAVSVLRLKGHLANTIHRSFYHVVKINGTVYFRPKMRLPSVIKLLIIDEMGMVNDKMMEEILALGIPTIGLGDPGQLPPVFGKNTFISKSDVLLTQVMRQSDTSGILTLATLAREDKEIHNGIYGDSKVVYGDGIGKLSDYDMVICWRNATRKYLNQKIREELGHSKMPYPVKGEKLICLRNNYVHEIDIDDILVFVVNGLNCVTIGDTYDEKEDLPYVEIPFKPDFMKSDEPFFHVKCDRRVFDEYRGLVDELPEEPVPLDEEIVEVDFGYAVTCHKSQGSEWDNVLVIDEYAGKAEDAPRFLYTALTRARKSVTLTRL